jgi:hypothetical protein
MKLACLALALLLAQPVLATEGVVEINQVGALAGGITTGDAPGFPVRLTGVGSYRLTSDLDAPAGVAGIDISADSVSLDLNGFAIRGPLPCGPGSACPGTLAGVSGAARTRISVRNGQVANFPGPCIALGSAAQVERVLVQACASGIETLSGLVVGNRVRDVVTGLRLGSSGFRENNVSASGRSVEGGRATGGNLCADRGCTSDGRRRFYLTPSSAYTGGEALAACDAGFHFASVWELVDLAALAYDASRGATFQDVDTGPPADLAGWLGSGNPIGTSGQCNEWSSSSASVAGHARFLELLQFHPLLRLNRFVASCDTPLRVWCVED